MNIIELVQVVLENFKNLESYKTNKVFITQQKLMKIIISCDDSKIFKVYNMSTKKKLEEKGELF